MSTKPHTLWANIFVISFVHAKNFSDYVHERIFRLYQIKNHRAYKCLNTGPIKILEAMNFDDVSNLHHREFVSL